jgi:propionyl-CoA carboxylase alpha chain
MAEAAIAVAKACDYENAGTIEFLVDKNRNFYFLEMNTRLQVEHPVTELITGLDLVQLQILVAQGRELPLKQGDIKKQGHAVECRIYAEDPRDNFLPSTGRLTKHRIPSGNGIRVDAGVEEGQSITINYDPMISKLCSYGKNREEAIQRMLRALEEYEIAGSRTTIPFCRYVLQHNDFRTAEYDTHFVPDIFDPTALDNGDTGLGDIRSVAAALLKRGQSEENNQSSFKRTAVSQNSHSLWWKKRQNR